MHNCPHRLQFKKLTPFIASIFIFGCSNLNIFYSKEKMLYHEAMNQALERNWKQRKSQNEREIIWHDAYQDPSRRSAGNVCLGGNKDYEIEKIPGRSACAGCPTTSVSFCSSEKRYWVSICGGDPVFTCRWTGPFEFDPQQDPIYMKARSILNQHDGKTLRKLNSKNIGDMEPLRQF